MNGPAQIAHKPTLKNASTYDEWTVAAIADDEKTGAAKWKRLDESRRYDYQVIGRRLTEVKEVRASGDPHRLLYYLNEGIHGNMGGMGSSSLYRKARFGTKDLITQYIHELAGAIEQVADIDDADIPFPERLEFFRRASHCFGRSALMLSGGGSLGPFHVGVIKALLEQDLLPNVISGSSAGSMIAAIVGTHTREELFAGVFSSTLTLAAEEIAEGGSAMLRGNKQLSIDEVSGFAEERIPDMTFQEAYEHTGVAINITVSPRQLHQQPRLLNATTSPNVFIREAVLASCAVPGVFPPVTLAAKNAQGERQPYVPSRQWMDGSMTDDLPAKRLARLYGANHFITSQTNPVIIWAIRDTQRSDSLLGKLWEINQNATREWLKATYPFVNQITKRIYPLNMLTRMGYNLATQDYTADINILPRRQMLNPMKLLAVISEEETRALVAAGEAATWPKIEMIRNCTLISRTLDRIRGGMEHEYTIHHGHYG
jgi:NTE family protein